MTTSPPQPKVAYLFPGQGSQKIEMLADIAERYPQINKIFAAASRVLNYDLWQLVQHGPEEQLNSTEFTQPAMLVADVAAWHVVSGLPNFVRPCFMAGHSLGEYAALVCAKALKFTDAVTLVANRGKLMQNAVQTGDGAMAAIIGLDDEAIENLCKKAANDNVLTPANYNSIGQTVLSGNYVAVERAVSIAKEFGAIKAQMLAVSVPAHCELMKPAADKLTNLLQNIDITAPQIPIIHNVDLKSHEQPDAIRAILTKQLYSPVNWVGTIKYLANSGVTKFVECGNGRVLAGLNKRIVREIPTENFINLLNL